MKLQSNLFLEHSSWVSLFNSTKCDYQKNLAVRRIAATQHTMAKCLSVDDLIECFLQTIYDCKPDINKNDIVLTACLKNETYLRQWLDHYRNLGVTKFLLVDDGSFESISEKIKDKDVWVWKPKNSLFRYAKAFWLELLLRKYALGCWVLTVDGDEYLDLPVKNNEQQSLQTFISQNTSSKRYFTCLLLDMLPAPSSYEKILKSQCLSLSDFNQVLCAKTSAPVSYLNNPANLHWYGNLTKSIYRLDARFHLNGTLDCLRKIAFFFMTDDTHITQGFHDLLTGSKKISVRGLELKDLLGIRHYKLLNVSLDTQQLRPAAAYYGGGENIQKLEKNIKQILVSSCQKTDTVTYTDIKSVCDLFEETS